MPTSMQPSPPGTGSTLPHRAAPNQQRRERETGYCVPIRARLNPADALSVDTAACPRLAPCVATSGTRQFTAVRTFRLGREQSSETALGAVVTSVYVAFTEGVQKVIDTRERTQVG